MLGSFPVSSAAMASSQVSTSGGALRDSATPLACSTTAARPNVQQSHGGWSATWYRFVRDLPSSKNLAETPSASIGAWPSPNSASSARNGAPQTGSLASTPVAANNTSRVARNFVRSSSFGSLRALDTALSPPSFAKALRYPDSFFSMAASARPGFALSSATCTRNSCSFRRSWPFCRSAGGSRWPWSARSRDALAALSALRLTAGRCSSLVTGARAWRSATARAAAANRRKRIMVCCPWWRQVMLPQSDGRTERATSN